MKKILYLHIGMHKTGTTALQKFLSLNDEVLAGQGVCYPKTGRTGQALAHHDIANSLKGPPFPLRAPEQSVDEYLAGIRDCFNAFPSVLLSSEIFMRFVPAFRDHLGLDLPRLGQLAATADTVKVIIYLRRQDEYLESFYSQEIQHDLHMSFPEFVEARLPDYFALCQELAAFFGKSNLIVRVYDRNRFSGGTIFSDFLSVLGIDHIEKFVIPEQDINPSLTPDEREFKKLINTLDFTIGELVRFNEPLVRLSRARRRNATALEGGAALLSPAGRSDLLHECSAVNRRVAAEFVDPRIAGDALFDHERRCPAQQQPVYPGLSSQTLAEIIAYIEQCSPELVASLREAADRGLESSDSAAGKAAAMLKAALGSDSRGASIEP